MKTNNITLEQKLNTCYGIKDFTGELSVKDVDLSKRIVTGYYNSFWYVDSQGDVILPGAFSKSIQERGANSTGIRKIKHALFHDLTKLPGIILVLKEDEFGEYFETKMLDTEEGNDTLIKYQEGVYTEHSIGYRYVNGKIQLVTPEMQEWALYFANIKNKQIAVDNGYFWAVSEVYQYEGSTVAFGANEYTPYLGSKNNGNEKVELLKLQSKIDKMDSLLHNGKLSDNGFYQLELELLQTKQYIKNLIELKPFEKPQPQNNTTEKTQPESTVINLDRVLNHVSQTIIF